MNAHMDPCWYQAGWQIVDPRGNAVEITVDDLYLAFRQRFAADLLEAIARTGNPYSVITEWSKS